VKNTVTNLGRLKNASVEVDKVQLGNGISVFIANTRYLTWCGNKIKGNFVKCKYKKKLQGGNKAVSFLSSVTCMTKSDQDAMYKELFNGSHHRSGSYNIHSGDNKAYGYSLLLCRNTFINVLSIGRKRHAKLLETHLVSGRSINKYVVNTHATLSPDVTDSVVHFIKYRYHAEDEVYVIIRSLNGHELRDEEKGGSELTFQHITLRDVQEVLI
jgi:hypothetical protein